MFITLINIYTKILFQFRFPEAVFLATLKINNVTVNKERNSIVGDRIADIN